MSSGCWVAKYNRLLEIEAEFGNAAKCAGRDAYAKWIGEVAHR